MLDVQRARLLRESMLRAGIGQGWRNRTRFRAISEFTAFEAKFKRRAQTDAQWNEAWQYYQAQLVAFALGCS